MLDHFLAMFGVHRVGMVTAVASQVIRTFEQEFALDQNAKIVAIESLIDVLQKHKDSLDPVTSSP